MQIAKRSIQEAWVNTLIGILINQLVLFAFGIPLKSAGAITVIMIALSTIRSYVIRRIFNKKDATKQL